MKKDKVKLRDVISFILNQEKGVGPLRVYPSHLKSTSFDARGRDKCIEPGCKRTGDIPILIYSQTDEQTKIKGYMCRQHYKEFMQKNSAHKCRVCQYFQPLKLGLKDEPIGLCLKYDEIVRDTDNCRSTWHMTHNVPVLLPPKPSTIRDAIMSMLRGGRHEINKADNTGVE